MPDLSLLIAAGVYAAGMLTGRYSLGRRSKGPEPVKPVCGCEHELSFHDPKSGECHAMMYVPSSASRGSYHTSCTCRQYSGPQPLPEYFAPEISG